MHKEQWQSEREGIVLVENVWMCIKTWIASKHNKHLSLQRINQERGQSAVTYFPAEAGMGQGAIRLPPAGRQLKSA